MTTLISAAWLAVGMTIPLAGTVVDSNGRPVAGARVWLADTHAAHKGDQTLATAETDANGGFRLERDADLEGRGSEWSPTLWAYKPGARIAHLEFKRSLPAADESVRLTLGPPSSIPCQVFRPDGKPAEGAVLRPVGLNIRAPRPPDTLRDRLAATTDAEGRATLDGLAPSDVSAIDATYDGQLVQYLPIDPDDGAVSLLPLGDLKVRLVADDPEAVRGWEVTATSRPARVVYPSTHWRRETTGADGRIAFAPMAEGVVALKFKPPEGSRYLVEKQPAAKIRAGETEEVEVRLVRGVRVEGVVREAPGDAPASGVHVDVQSLAGGSDGVRDLTTDARGRFTAVVRPGKVRFSYSSLERTSKEYYLPAGVQNWGDFEVEPGEDRHEISPPPLRKAALVRGRVLDVEGGPIALAKVAGRWSVEQPGSVWSHGVQTSTDARGEFVLGSLAPGASVNVSASSGWVLVSDPVVVPRAGEGEPISLRLHRKPTLALSGRVLDPDGRPIAGALIRVSIRPPGQPYMVGGGELGGDGSAEIRTDADGRYKTPDELPLDHERRVAAEAPGCEPGATRWLADPKAEVPDLTLKRSIPMRVVVGRVVDSSGAAVVGAEVFQSGDGPTRTQGLTDADGRFRVKKVPDRPALLFVARDGYRFDGRRIETGGQPLQFVLRRLDEPPAVRLGAAPSPVSRDDERALARDLIDQVRKDPRSQERFMLANWIVMNEALVDADRTIKKIEDQVIGADSGVLANVAVGRSEGDPRKVLEVLDLIDSSFAAATTALNLFDRLGPSARSSFRRDLLERAERAARKVDALGSRASLLAGAADRRLDLGDLDRGSALAREALAVAETPDEPGAPVPHNGGMVVFVGDPADKALHGARGVLATALARVDLAAALKLVDGQDRTPHGLDQVRRRIAERIAGTNPKEARRLLDQHQEFLRTVSLRLVCVRMAENDWPAARAMAAEANDPALQAVLPAFAAKAQAESDPQAARELLREAVERVGALDYHTGVEPTPAVLLARLLPLVVRIDPDRASSCLWRALSRRPPPPVHTPSFESAYAGRQYFELAELAALVSRYDRAAAQVVFAPLVDRLPELAAGTWGLGADGARTFRAAGTYDARAALALLDSLPDDPPPPTMEQRVRGGPSPQHVKADARSGLAEILAVPSRLRLRELFRSGLGVDDWLEGLDDDRGPVHVEGP